MSDTFATLQDVVVPPRHAAQGRVRNRLLASLPEPDLQLVLRRLDKVSLTLRQVVQEANRPLQHVHFPETALISLIAVEGNERIEVGILGLDGMAGLPVVLGVDESPHEGLVQVAGSALSMPVAELRACLRESEALAATLARAAHVLHVQVSQTALANGRQTVEQRLARWLLMAHDRLEGDQIGLTHEFLAFMLGVRRPGVTVALHLLEGNGAIRSKRNVIVILDRDILKRIAGPSYGRPEALFETLLGTPLARP